MGTTRKEFETVFPSLVDDLVHHCKQYNMPEDALNWYRDVSQSCSTAIRSTANPLCPI